MKQQIQRELKEALLQKDELKTATLRMLLAALINKEKEKNQHELAEEEIQQAVVAEVKKRREAAEAFQKAGRIEMAEKERNEMEILQKYLPEQLAENEIRELVKEAIEQTGARNSQDMGKVMAAVMPKVKGKADGALVSSIVKEVNFTKKQNSVK